MISGQHGTLTRQAIARVEGMNREMQLEEINLIAVSLGYIDGDDRAIYEALLGTYFNDKKSARELDDMELSEWLAMLRLWQQPEKRS